MSQQQYVTMLSGHVYEFDEFDFQYHCAHELWSYEDIEVDTVDSRGEHDTYNRKIKVCDNEDCHLEDGVIIDD